MLKFVSFNYEIKESAQTSISSVSNGSLYGKGVFTTLAICDGDAFLWQKHWRRLLTSSEKLEINIANFSESNVKDALAQLIQKNRLLDGKARITFFDESSSKIWPARTKKKTSFLITIGEPKLNLEIIRATFSPYLKSCLSPLAGIKSCNYLDTIMTLDEAKARGFDEAIQINERREITSACMANVFWVSGGELFTPSLTTGCLAGTTREFVMENIDCREVEAQIEELETSEAIFLTSAGIGVVQVAEFEGKRFEKIDHPILHLLPY